MPEISGGTKNRTMTDADIYTNLSKNEKTFFARQIAAVAKGKSSCREDGRKVL